IATQREELRKKFKGTPEDVVAFFALIAEEVREILASIGRRTLADVVGDTSVIAARKFSSDVRASRVSVAGLLESAPVLTPAFDRVAAASPAPLRHVDDGVLARLSLAHGVTPSIRHASVIGNGDRSAGAKLAGELVRALQGEPLRDGAIHLKYR